MPHLLSVNVGRPEPQAGVRDLTGINKQRQPGPVTIGLLGLEGDAVLDTRHHGGPDQAVYIYFDDDYDWWAQELGFPVAPGTFGDNLTIAGVIGQEVAVGDRLTVGRVALEVTLHRTPCNTLARHMGDPKFVKRFHQARRPGAYARVLVPGSVTAGDAVTLLPLAGERVLLTDLMGFDGAREIPAAFMERALRTPLHGKLRGKFEARLAGTG